MGTRSVYDDVLIVSQIKRNCAVIAHCAVPFFLYGDIRLNAVFGFPEIMLYFYTIFLQMLVLVGIVMRKRVTRCNIPLAQRRGGVFTLAR